MPLILATLFPPTSSAARFGIKKSVSQIEDVPTARDLSVGVGWQCSMKEEFERGTERRLGSLGLWKVLAPRMIFDQLQLTCSILGIEQTFPRPYSRNCSGLQSHRQDKSCTFSGR